MVKATLLFDSERQTHTDIVYVEEISVFLLLDPLYIFSLVHYW